MSSNNEWREEKEVTKEVLEFRDLFTVSCLFFTPYSSALDTYQLEFHKILEISQDRKDQITVYFDSFAL